MDCYPLTHQTEHAVSFLLAADKAFFYKFGHEVQPDLLTNPIAQAITRASLDIAKDIEDPPGSAVSVSQRIHNWMTQGKIKPALASNAQFVLESEDVSFFDTKSIGHELSLVLKQYKKKETVHKVVHEWGIDGDLTKYADQFREIELIGERSDVHAWGLDEASINALLRPDAWERLPFGVAELDVLTHGGLARGKICMIIGRSGEGKSLALTQIAGAALIQGKNVAYISLENEDPETMLRIVTPMTGWVLDYTRHHPVQAGKAFLEYAKANDLGQLIFFKMPSGSSVQECRAMLERKCKEKRIGMPDVVCFDYLDLAGDSETLIKSNRPGREKKAAQDHFTFKRITRDWADWIASINAYGYTAAQAKAAKSENHKFLTLEDVAESMHKVRIHDMVLTLNKDGVIFIPKHRQGANGVATSATNHDRNTALFAPSGLFPATRDDPSSMLWN